MGRSPYRFGCRHVVIDVVLPNNITHMTQVHGEGERTSRIEPCGTSKGMWLSSESAPEMVI